MNSQKFNKLNFYLKYTFYADIEELLNIFYKLSY